MNRRKEILDELVDVPALAAIDNQGPYKVPEGYFELLPEQILRRVKIENATSAKEEIEAISPLLAGISRKMPFTTPVGYFEKSNSLVGLESESKPQARVIKMFQPPRRFRMAAAAVVVAIVGLAGWLMFRQPVTTHYAVKSENQIQKELEPRVNQLSDSELANFVDGAMITTFYTANPVEISEEDVKLMLADISDHELEKYVDQNALKEKYN